MGSRPEVMNDSALAVGLDELCDRLVKRAQRSGDLRKDLEWEDIPMIACGLGRITPAEMGPATGRWPRLVEIIIDGLRAPGSSKLPKPAHLVQRVFLSGANDRQVRVFAICSR